MPVMSAGTGLVGSRASGVDGSGTGLGWRTCAPGGPVGPFSFLLFTWMLGRSPDCCAQRSNQGDSDTRVAIWTLAGPRSGKFATSVTKGGCGQVRTAGGLGPMSCKSKPLMLRLPDVYQPALDRLFDEFQGLAPGAILRFVLVDFLKKPIHEQVNIIDRQVRGSDASRPEKRP